MLKTAIYVRVSTAEQAQEGYSIRAQIDKLKSYILIKDWNFYKVYADEGIGGKNVVDRPVINELINDVRAGNVNNVLVYKIDRLTRSTRDLIDLTDIFRKYNCNFNSLMESIDTQTASGRMFLKIICIFTEFEHENIIERIPLACEKKVKEGYTLSSNKASYGYDRENGEKIQTINHEEAEVVKEIYAMYIDGNMSFTAIVQDLNHRNIKPKLGGAWGHVSVRAILKNPNYIGKVRYSLSDENRYFEADGKHEPIISEELFYNAQNKMDKIKRKSYTKRPKAENYFSGTIYCGVCGARLITHREYRTNKAGERVIKGHYRCPNVEKGICNNPTFSHRKTETAFQEYMNDIQDIKVADDTMLEETSKEDSINNIIKEEYENAIEKLGKKEKDVMTLYLNDRIDFDDYESMKKPHT
ncbi:MAG: recombinase family protein [Oscillospiraceae bacterium]|nr:recombinase family protein [Oscillospiraceae bacterium]